MTSNREQSPASATLLTGMDAVIQLKDALAAAGLPRTSTLNGGDLRGWTRCCGSTGFSIRLEGERIVWQALPTPAGRSGAIKKERGAEKKTSALRTVGAATAPLSQPIGCTKLK